MRKCSLLNCGRKAKSRGYCGPHYTRWRRHGDPREDIPIKRGKCKYRICTLLSCNTEHFAKGYCKFHYKRYKNHGDPLEDVVKKISKEPKGSITIICRQCDKEFTVNYSHAEYRKHCSAECYAKAKKVKMGKIFTTVQGYCIVRASSHPLANNSGNVLIHWLVAYDYAYKLNRTKEEVLEMKKSGFWTIHHINGKRDDNKIDNLEFRMKGKHPKGIGISDAIQILEANGYSISK